MAKKPTRDSEPSAYESLAEETLIWVFGMGLVREPRPSPSPANVRAHAAWAPTLPESPAVAPKRSRGR